MRRFLILALLSSLLVVVNSAPGEASVITVQWSGPSADIWEAVRDDMTTGGPGIVDDTEFYKGCGIFISAYCHYLWNNGLSAGQTFDPRPELFVPEDGSIGFELSPFQSMPDFYIRAECKPSLFDSCYSAFTPLSIDWDLGRAELFVWLSSKGGTMFVDNSWTGLFDSTAEWQDVEWIRGVYPCVLDPGVYGGCEDIFDPNIYGLTIEGAVPEPTTLALCAVAALGASIRLRRRRADRAE